MTYMSERERLITDYIFSGTTEERREKIAESKRAYQAENPSVNELPYIGIGSLVKANPEYASNEVLDISEEVVLLDTNLE